MCHNCSLQKRSEENTIFCCASTHRGICLHNHFTPLVSLHWGQTGCQQKWKTSRNLNFLVLADVFQSELKNFQRCPKLNQRHEKNAIFGWFFENYSILTEKQQAKLHNSSSLMFSASFDTQFTPNGARLGEISLFIHFVLKFDNSGTL